MPRVISEIKAILTERKLLAARRAQEEQRTSPQPHHGFDPNQPRVAAGNPDGGKWTSSGQDGTRVLSDALPDNAWMARGKYAQSPVRGGSGRGGGPTRTGGPSEPMEGGQGARLTAAEGQRRDAISRVRELDPGWKPTPSFYESPEGLIRTNLAEAREAEAHLAKLYSARRRSIDEYWLETHPPDMLGYRGNRNDGTISVVAINRDLVLGTNSTAPGYTTADRNAAFRMRDRLITNYPKAMTTEGNIGEWPNDAVFHAEATVLMRAARANGGAPFGRTIQVYSDREMCGACDRVLPSLGLELGNPRVTFVGPNGSVSTMHNGNWLSLGVSK